MRLRLYPPRSARKWPAQAINTSRGNPPMSQISLSRPGRYAAPGERGDLVRLPQVTGPEDDAPPNLDIPQLVEVPMPRSKTSTWPAITVDPYGSPTRNRHPTTRPGQGPREPPVRGRWWRRDDGRERHRALDLLRNEPRRIAGRGSRLLAVATGVRATGSPSGGVPGRPGTGSTTSCAAAIPNKATHCHLDSDRPPQRPLRAADAMGRPLRHFSRKPIRRPYAMAYRLMSTTPPAAAPR